jgi:hypothetical protein
LIDADFGETGVSNDALVKQRLHGVELFVRRDFAVDAVELPELVLLDAEALQAALRVSDQFFRTAILAPLVRTGASEAALGGDKQAIIRMQRFADEFLRHMWPVGFGSVDKVHAEFGQTPQSGKRFGFVFRLAPNARTGHAHGAEA